MSNFVCVCARVHVSVICARNGDKHHEEAKTHEDVGRENLNISFVCAPPVERYRWALVAKAHQIF